MADKEKNYIDEYGFNALGINGETDEQINKILKEMVDSELKRLIEEKILPMQMNYEKQVHEMHDTITALKDATNALNKDVKFISDSPVTNETNVRERINAYHIAKTSNLDKKFVVKNNLEKYIRQSEFKTKQIVAEKIGISSSALSNIISGKYSTSIEVCLKLAKLLNISVEELFYLEEQNDDYLPL